MRPIFTIHAGEYLVATEIERAFPHLQIWIPSKDTGVDLLVTDREQTKVASLQVKFSKDYLGSAGSRLHQRWSPAVGGLFSARIASGQASIQSYFTVTAGKRCWETRGLDRASKAAIETGTYKNPDREFSQYLNAWPFKLSNPGRPSNTPCSRRRRAR